ncbi:Pseudouridylates U2 snRNA at position 35 [Giardia lamblia P15]|uniref:Pseudouridylates U2 snRNA at position 35 n=1 Tax=Giardia intestinalis (strain P15) TaxID=658858 RepID=E1F4D6_GIAIA|nr:Pseudouridylates U2 snRNA at position 35 [Giardia lamblia P15]
MNLDLTPYAPDIGITSLLTDQSTPVPALIKLYYSDFIVRELDLDGAYVRLKEVAAPVEPELDAYNCYLSEPEMKRVQLSAIIQTAPELKYLSTENRELLTAIYSTPSPVSLEATSLHFFPMPPSKEARRSVHSLLNSINRLDIATSTVIDPGENDGEQTYRLKIQPQKPRIPRPSEKYTHFVLEKAGLDTMQAITSMVARMHPQFRCKVNDFTYRGTKDKRGVTVQRVCAKGAWPSVLSATSLTSSGMYLQMGDFSFSSEPLRLGAHLGNSFELILRGIPHTAAEYLSHRLFTIESHGFINYFGHQRFGSRSIGTHHIGVAILSGQYSDALWMIVRTSVECRLKPTVTTCDSFKDVMTSIANKDAKSFESSLSKLLDDAGKSLSAFSSTFRLVRESADPLVALLKHIPRSMQTMYIHAFQAYLFNLATSRCIVRIKDEIATGTRKVATNCLLLNDPVYVRGTTIRIENKIHLITADDLVKGTYALNDLAIPLLGTKTIQLLEDAASKLPRSLLADVYETYKDTLLLNGLSFDFLSTMTQRTVVPKELSPLLRTFIPIGDVRLLLVVPKDLEMCWIRHASLTDTLGVTDMDILAGKRPHVFSKVSVVEPPSTISDTKANYRSLALRFSLSSSVYATEFLRELLGATVDPESQKKILAYYKITVTNVAELDDQEWV